MKTGKEAQCAQFCSLRSPSGFGRFCRYDGEKSSFDAYQQQLAHKRKGMQDRSDSDGRGFFLAKKKY